MKSFLLDTKICFYPSADGAKRSSWRKSGYVRTCIVKCKDVLARLLFIYKQLHHHNLQSITLIWLLHRVWVIFHTFANITQNIQLFHISLDQCAFNICPSKQQCRTDTDGKALCFCEPRYTGNDCSVEGN